MLHSISAVASFIFSCVLWSWLLLCKIINVLLTRIHIKILTKILTTISSTVQMISPSNNQETSHLQQTLTPSKTIPYFLYSLDIWLFTTLSQWLFAIRAISISNYFSRYNSLEDFNCSKKVVVIFSMRMKRLREDTRKNKEIWEKDSSDHNSKKRWRQTIKKLQRRSKLLKNNQWMMKKKDPKKNFHQVLCNLETKSMQISQRIKMW